MRIDNAQVIIPCDKRRMIGIASYRSLQRLGFVLSTILLSGCVSLGGSAPEHNICALFAQNPSWRDAVYATQRKWGAPAHVQMAIIWKESSFRSDARPPRKEILFGLATWGHVSSAYGYSQALDGTWERYLEETGRSSWFASRDDFADASDFVGWYMSKSYHVNGVPMSDAISQYLNYHEGHTGYRQGTYRSKAWLINAAQRVGLRAERYRRQLLRCQ